MQAISVGFLISAGICLWWGLGAIACNPPKEILPPRLDGCGGPLDSLAIFENDALFNQTFFNGTGAHFAPLAMAPQKEAALYPPEGVIPIITQAPMLLKPETWYACAIIFIHLFIVCTHSVHWEKRDKNQARGKKREKVRRDQRDAVQQSYNNHNVLINT